MLVNHKETPPTREDAGELLSDFLQADAAILWDHRAPGLTSQLTVYGLPRVEAARIMREAADLLEAEG